MVADRSDVPTPDRSPRRALPRARRRAAGATIGTAELYEFTNGLRGEDGEAVRAPFIDAVTSPGIEPSELEFVKAENARFRLESAADLLHDNALRDWRPFMRTIRVPTLVVAGNSVNVPMESQRWIHGQIRGSSFAVVEGVDGGTHFPFIESPDRFNDVVGDFLRSV